MKKHKKLIGWLSFLLGFLVIMVTVLSVVGWDGKGIEFFLQTVLLDNFLAVNSLLLGTFTFVGYLLLGRGFSNALIGMIKTMIGVLLLAIGSGALVGLAKPIFDGLQSVTSASVDPIDPYLGWASSNNFLAKGISSTQNYVSWVSFALMLGFAFNMVLIAFKRLTNVHSLFVTGHIMFQQTAIVTALVYLFLFRDINPFNGNVPAGVQAGVIGITGILMGTYWGTASTSTIKPTNKVTNNAGFAIGHQQMWGAALAYKLGRFIGNPKNSAETRKLPEKIKIFEDNIFTQSIIIMTLFIILIVIIKYAGPGWDPTAKGSEFGSWKIAENAFWFINVILGSLQVVAALLAIIAGVRMFVTELQQSFQGIAEKILPGAVVGVDVAATYGFSPNAVVFGFMSGVIAQFTAVGIIIGISVATDGAIPIVIPLFITLFFNSGTMGIFANASGGFRACIIIPAVMGFVGIILASGALATVNNAYENAVTNGTAIYDENNKTASPVAQGYIGMADWNIFWGIIFIIGGQNVILGWITFAIFWLLMLFSSQIIDSGIQDKKTFFQKIFGLNPDLIKSEIKAEKKPV